MELLQRWGLEGVAELFVLVYFGGIGIGIAVVGAVRGWEKFRGAQRDRRNRRRRGPR